MKTRQEMIYDFMIALAANSERTDTSIYETAQRIYDYAEALTDKYVENYDVSE